MDQETWNEIGVLLKELMKKMEEKDVYHNFTFKAWLGEESKTFSVFNNYSKSEFLVGLQRWLLPNEARPNDIRISGTMENERIAIKLRNPETYYKTWDKKDKNKEITGELLRLVVLMMWESQ